MTRSQPEMPRISPVPLDELDKDTRALMEQGNEVMGFIANDGLTMARVPGLLQAMSSMVRAAYQPGRVNMETKRMVGLMNSQAAGCVYCQHHAKFGSKRAGISQEKLDALWEYESSAVFSEAERAALRVAHLAGVQPNQVEDQHFEELKRHYTEDECAEIVAVIAMFGFLNSWNDTIKTEPEDLAHLLTNQE